MMMMVKVMMQHIQYDHWIMFNSLYDTPEDASFNFIKPNERAFYRKNPIFCFNFSTKSIFFCVSLFFRIRAAFSTVSEIYNIEADYEHDHHMKTYGY